MLRCIGERDEFNFCADALRTPLLLSFLIFPSFILSFNFGKKKNCLIHDLKKTVGAISISTVLFAMPTNLEN